MVLVVTAGLLCACSTTTGNAVAPHLPALSSVVGARFVSSVELDHGNLVVTPAGKAKPRLSLQVAQAMFDAADAVDGSYRFAVFGLGRATVSPEVSAPATTTTAAGGITSTTTTTSATPTTSTTSTTTTTSADTGASTMSSSPAPTTSPTIPPTPTPTTPPLPRYDKRLAWVGIAWGSDCPTPPGASPLATRYVVVVIDADTGHSVIAYSSRSSAACGGPVLAPSISRPTELVSVPWQPVGPASTAVRVTMPACSAYFGWTEVPAPSASSVQVVVRTPFDPTCGSTATSTLVVDDVVPLGTPQNHVPHAALGPVDALRTLPGG